MSNEIDLLMSLDPLEMTSEDIDSLIAIYRNNRAAREGAVGSRTKKDTGPKKELGDILDKVIAKPAVQTITRRI